MAWTFAATRAAFGDRDVIGVVCGGRRVALYRLQGEYFATSDVCPHQGAALSEGCVVEGFIECPLHFALFDIRSGAADGGVTTTGVRTFATKVEGDGIHIEIDAQPAVVETI